MKFARDDEWRESFYVGRLLLFCLDAKSNPNGLRKKNQGRRKMAKNYSVIFLTAFSEAGSDMFSSIYILLKCRVFCNFNIPCHIRS